MKFKSEQTTQKLRGGYYTPMEVALFLTKFAVNNKTKRILEPSCGDGVFLEALASTNSSVQIDGVELDNIEAQKARLRGKENRLKFNIINDDFLNEDNPVKKNKYDAIIGNPPYIRYQFLEPETQKRSARIFDLAGLEFTKHTNLWVTFVIASIQNLENSGRIAMIIPAEILNVIHPGQLRKYLLTECSKILIIDCQELVFTEALQGTVLLLAEKKKSSNKTEEAMLAIRYEKNLKFLQRSPVKLFQQADYVPTYPSEDKWMLPLLSSEEREVLDRVSKLPSVRRFGDIAKIEVGMVTGANDFFLVTDTAIAEYSLEKYALPMIGRSQHLKGVLYTEEKHANNRELQLPVNYINFPSQAKNELEKNLQRYINEGEQNDLHLRYKTRIRDPWYVVPSKWVPQLFLLKRSYTVPRLVVNEIGALNTDTAYRVTTEEDPISFAFSFYNSLTAISTELEGRSYGGGVLELVPSEVRRLIIPFVKASRKQIEQLDKAIGAKMSTDQILIIQDQIILKEIGLSDSDIKNIQKARVKLQSRRFRIDEPVEGTDNE